MSIADLSTALARLSLPCHAADTPSVTSLAAQVIDILEREIAALEAALAAAAAANGPLPPGAEAGAAVISEARAVIGEMHRMSLDSEKAVEEGARLRARRAELQAEKAGMDVDLA